MRKSWQVSFRSSDDLRDRERHTRQHYSNEADTGQPCACANRCAERDYQGNPKPGPRNFCTTDRDFIGRAITNLPSDYVQLWLMLPRSGQAGERVSGSREPPLPLALDVQAFMRELVLVACSWEEAVRRVARLADLPDGHRRDAAALSAACRTLYAHLDTLLALEPETVTRSVTRKRLTEIEDEPGLMVWWDRAGDAWQAADKDGTAAGLELLHLHSRARGMLGLNRGRLRITEVPCDDCGAKTLVQPEALAGGLEPVVRCTACPNAYVGARFDLLMGRVYEAQIDALNKHERDKRRVAA